MHPLATPNGTFTSYPATPCHPQVTVYVYQLVEGDVKVEKIDSTKAP